MSWYRVDLHLHTPASKDYQEANVTYLDILRKAAAVGLDIIAFTDHNTVGGVRAMRKEIEELELLEQLQRIRPEEKIRLDEYRRLLEQVLVLPGFELTATLGFHVLGIFPAETNMRTLDHILMSLRVPPDQLDEGSTQVGATVDVLTAYSIINNAGGLAIAAHANSSHGVAMQGFDFGGQTKIAYTQDSALHALEVTDLESKRRRTTANFFNGSKPEYPRRMHCIQGSDAHRLNFDPQDKNRFGVGDRVTEVKLSDASFDALKELFLSKDFSRTRPFRRSQAPFDHVLAARQQGTNIVQSFYESVTRRGGDLYNILCDICAFANGNGGTIFVGLSDDIKKPVVGLDQSDKAAATIRSEVEKKLNPPLEIEIDEHQTQGKKVLQISVPSGDDMPYVLDDYKIYVRDETDSNLAVRDEIVALVKQSVKRQIEPKVSGPAADEQVIEPISPSDVSPEPKTGVEIVLIETRKGTNFYSLRDLRNGNIVHNVTKQSARKLWQYAITEHEKEEVNAQKIDWRGDIGVLKKYNRGGQTRFDLVQREPDHTLHVYYGVTEDGIHGPWQPLLDSLETA